MARYAFVMTMGLLGVFTTCYPSTSEGARIQRGCQPQLEDLTETVRVLYFPRSEYFGMSHTLLEVAGEVWTALGGVRKPDNYAVYVRNASINTPFIATSVRVSKNELKAIIQDLHTNAYPGSRGTCSGALYRYLMSKKIMNGSALPAQLPLVMMSKFVLESAFKNPRIEKIEWVGRKPRPIRKYMVSPIVESTYVAYAWLVGYLMPSVDQSIIESSNQLIKLLSRLSH